MYLGFSRNLKMKLAHKYVDRDGREGERETVDDHVDNVSLEFISFVSGNRNCLKTFSCFDFRCSNCIPLLLLHAPRYVPTYSHDMHSLIMLIDLG